MKTWGWISLASVLVSALAGILLGAGGYTFVYAKGYSYMSDDPQVCANCHVMRDHLDGWQKSPHHAVATCNDCHLPHDSLVGKFYVKASNGYYHSKGFTFQDFHEPIQIKPGNAKVLEDNCLRCHQALNEQVTSHHDFSTGELFGCVKCHSDVGHGPRK